MNKIEFNDGVEFDIDGAYRVEHRHDGFYVVGRGILCAVDSYVDGIALIQYLKSAGPKSGT